MSPVGWGKVALGRALVLAGVLTVVSWLGSETLEEDWLGWVVGLSLVPWVVLWVSLWEAVCVERRISLATWGSVGVLCVGALSVLFWVVQRAYVLTLWSGTLGEAQRAAIEAAFGGAWWWSVKAVWACLVPLWWVIQWVRSRGEEGLLALAWERWRPWGKRMAVLGVLALWWSLWQEGERGLDVWVGAGATFLVALGASAPVQVVLLAGLAWGWGGMEGVVRGGEDRAGG